MQPIPGESLLFQVPSSSPGPSYSPSKTPQRLSTDPEGRHSPGVIPKAFKRIVVFCDGTWQDGLSAHHDEYTNVLRLARSVNYADERYNPPIPQIVYYQSGVGTEDNFHSRFIDGATGGNLGAKVEEAYAFIAHNYYPGDEIFLFGFSRGAYTARTVASFIGEIGVLDRRDMDHFADIFGDFQQLGECHGEEKKKYKARLAPWRKSDARGKLRADIDRDEFTVKCLGVWDTVGALGIPKELLPISGKTARLYGFHDQHLGEHIENAFQAMALHEMRSAFNICKFEQSDSGIAKRQTLRQCWFAGCHTDIGGGYEDHDLSDISLVWMAAQIESMLSLDLEYMVSHFEPVAEWGKQKPHDSGTGIFLLANKTLRTFPNTPNDPKTRETFHSSVLEQESLSPAVIELLTNQPDLIAPLTDLERQIKQNWRYDPNTPRAQKYAKAQPKRPNLVTPTSSDSSDKEKPASWVMQSLRTVVRTVSFKGNSRRHSKSATISSLEPATGEVTKNTNPPRVARARSQHN